MPYLLAALCGLIFGGADQYLGSLTAHGFGFWVVAVSLMSAPWLLLPFIFGARHNSAYRGAAIGALATLAALLGYFVMTLSPLEGVSLAHVNLAAELRGQARLIAEGVVTGPLFGYLGYRWHVKRSWPAATLAALALILEPLARVYTHRVVGPSAVWLIESCTGLALAAYFAARWASARRTHQTQVLG
jgi:hypothetical protein